MKDITKIKGVVFIDFDDTLFLWNYNLTFPTYAEQYAAHLRGEIFYPQYGIENKSLLQALQTISETHLIFLLTHDSSLALESKKVYLEELCPHLFDDYLTSFSKEDKIDIMKGCKNVLGEDLQYFLIDDCEETCVLARNNNITAFFPTRAVEIFMKAKAVTPMLEQELGE